MSVREGFATARTWISRLAVLLGFVIVLSSVTFHRPSKPAPKPAPHVLGVTLTATGKGNGNGPKKTFSMTGSVTGLYPGASLSLPITVENPNAQDIVVTSITATPISTDTSGCSAGTGNLSPGAFSGSLLVPGRGSAITTLVMSMPGTVADTCQDATFTLRITGQGRQA